METASRVLPRAWCERLRRELAAIYGERADVTLTDPQTAEEWIEAWGEALGWLTGEQIRNGLDALRARVAAGGAGWPLTSTEFCELCERGVVPEPRSTPTVRSRVRSAVASECMQRMREILKRPA